MQAGLRRELLFFLPRHLVGLQADHPGTWVTVGAQRLPSPGTEHFISLRRAGSRTGGVPGGSQQTPNGMKVQPLPGIVPQGLCPSCPQHFSRSDPRCTHPASTEAPHRSPSGVPGGLPHASLDPPSPIGSLGRQGHPHQARQGGGASQIQPGPWKAAPLPPTGQAAASAASHPDQPSFLASIRRKRSDARRETQARLSWSPAPRRR